MSTATIRPPGESAIWRRVVDRTQLALSQAAARAILRLDFDAVDRRRMHQLAARNRAGQLTHAEEQELDNFIHVGQLLGVLRSKARKSLRKPERWPPVPWIAPCPTRFAGSPLGVASIPTCQAQWCTPTPAHRPEHGPSGPHVRAVPALP